jgi:hypothetical protein
LRRAQPPKVGRGTSYPERRRRGTLWAKGLLHEQRRWDLVLAIESPNPNQSGANAMLRLTGRTSCVECQWSALVVTHGEGAAKADGIARVLGSGWQSCLERRHVWEALLNTVFFLISESFIDHSPRQIAGDQFGYKAWCLAPEHMPSMRRGCYTWLVKQSTTLLQVLGQVEIKQDTKLSAIITWICLNRAPFGLLSKHSVVNALPRFEASISSWILVIPSYAALLRTWKAARVLTIVKHHYKPSKKHV